MMPRINSALTVAKRGEYSNLTYKMDTDGEVIRGSCDSLNSVKQAVHKILSTERYQHYIYTPNYGVELLDLIGAPISYVCPELERRITEALVIDDRIDSVDTFTFDVKGGSVHASFVVHSVFGDFEGYKEVSY